MQTSVIGDGQQINYSPEYGEDKTAPYTVWNISANYTFPFKGNRTTIQLGVENLLNKFYSAYADWGNIPRIGRDIFALLHYEFL